MTTRDLAIVGDGLAGITAGLYASRTGLDSVRKTGSPGTVVLY
jgi:thioredoxin reductase